MKKSVMFMVGTLVLVLAGSAQAGTTMFAVQGGAPVADKFVVQDTGLTGIGTGTPTGGSLHVVATDTPILNDILGNNQTAGMGVDVTTSTGAPPAGPVQAANYSFLVKLNNGGAGISNNFNTFRLIARSDATNAENFTGQFAAANFQAQHQGSGNATYVVGFVANTALRGAGNITDAVAVDAATPGRPGSGTITNAKGVRIRAQKGTGITNGFGVYQEGTNDVNFFAGLLQAPNLPVFTDNTAAASLAVGTLYRTPAGVLMVRF
jgi:hypothetical protein